MRRKLERLTAFKESGPAPPIVLSGLNRAVRTQAVAQLQPTQPRVPAPLEDVPLTHKVESNDCQWTEDEAPPWVARR